MVRYLYSNNVNGMLVDISNVTTENREKYYCPSCGKEMSAVLGNKVEHHFRHKGDSCSYESYLHKISKLLLKWRFDNNPTFEISYYVTRNCPNVDCKLRSSSCKSDRIELHTVNLKECYDVCEIEGSYKEFRADVKLSNSDRPDAVPLFLEVAVSHKCSPDKKSSGVPIIEIDVANERDVLSPLTERFPETCTSSRSASPVLRPIENEIKFYNFNRDMSLKKKLSRFVIYKSKDGCIRGGLEKGIGLCRNVLGHHHKSALYEIQFENYDNNWSRYPIWYFGMYIAAKDGVDIKDCRICKNYKSCVASMPTDKMDASTKTMLLERIPIYCIDKHQLGPIAYICKHFEYNTSLSSQVFNCFKKLKYCVSKPYLANPKS